MNTLVFSFVMKWNLKLIWHIQWDTWLFLYYAKVVGNPYNFEHIFDLLVSKKKKKKKSIISTKKSMIRNLHKILHSGYPNLHSHQQWYRNPSFHWSTIYNS